MKIQDDPPVHLTYCLNVHPGETWQANFAAIRDHALRVRDGVADGRAFGLGLRLSDRAAADLADQAALAELADFMRRNRLYAFTVNGFPFGTFHGQQVKADVYRPDWRDPRRRDYTIRLANILAALLPEGAAGSISTVPGAYKDWIAGDDDVRAMVRMLADVGAHLARLRAATGLDLCLGLEPEPDCFLETTDEAIRFLGDWSGFAAEHLADAHGLDDEVWRRHVGICFDTAHAAVQFEDLADSLGRLARAGVRVCKVQLSAALEVRPTDGGLERLEAFRDPVYLHQVKARTAGGAILAYPDLPEALSAARAGVRDWDACRVHFHVPLFFDADGPLQSTARLFTPEFLEFLRGGLVPHLEIETYTFGVLPEFLQVADLDEGLAREVRWVLGKLLPTE